MINVHVTKAFRPYKIEINTSQDHQDMLRVLSDAIDKYASGKIGKIELQRLRTCLVLTQAGASNED
jgi:hypothetical protein